jgi:hypothetical protein
MFTIKLKPIQGLSRFYKNLNKKIILIYNFIVLKSRWHLIDMKIKIGTRYNLQFTTDEKNFLFFLEEDKWFEDVVGKIRKLMGIVVDKNHIDSSDKKKKIDSLSLLLVEVYETLAPYWYETFSSIITTGYAIPSEYKNQESISYAFEDENPFDEPFRKEFTLKIHTKISISKIKKFLNDNEAEINSLLLKLPKEPSIKNKNIDLGKEIDELKRSNTYYQIGGKKLKHINPKIDQAYNALAVVHGRYKTKAKEVLRKNLQSEENLEYILEKLEENLSILAK